MSYGLFVLTARDQKDNGCLINTCFQVAENPTQLVISVQKGNLTRQMIENTGVFNVSVLTKSVPFETIRHFGMRSGRTVDKFADFPGVKPSVNGLLYLTEHTNAMFSCQVLEKMDLGSHVMFVAKVTESKVLSQEESCTYAYYHKVIKTDYMRRSNMKNICPCGYEYDPALGDPENGVAPGTAWEDVPADWVCPICGLGKDSFTAE